jgi:D-3-phosphoglycerate dehydrogenase/phosphoserine aminotransferase
MKVFQAINNRKYFKNSFLNQKLKTNLNEFNKFNLSFNINNPLFLCKTIRMFSSVNKNKGKVLIADQVDPGCKEILERAGFTVDQKTGLSEKELVSIMPSYRGLIVRSATKVTDNILKAGKKLELIGRAGSGVDNIDLISANKLGKIVMNTPGGNTLSTAELTMSMIFACAREIPKACFSLKQGKWERKSFLGTELNGKVIGIIGLGKIGREVARFCQNFGMTTIGFDPILDASVANEYGIEKVQLDDLFKRSDFITVHTPLNSNTKDIINKESISKCKDGVRILNCARGGIINELDLLEGLKSGKVAGAAIDTYTTEPPTKEIMELISHPSVVCTPHLGANTNEAQVNVALSIARQFVNAFDNSDYFGVVNAGYIGLARKPHIINYIYLAERLGSISGQLLDGSLKKLTLNLNGDIISKNEEAEVISYSVLKGLLSEKMATGDDINLVNAPQIAKEVGLNIQVNKIHPSVKSVYKNSIEIILETDIQKHSITGIVHNDKMRLVEIDNYKLEFTPEGNILIIKHKDQPGQYSLTAKVLSDNNINVADISLGRIDTKAMVVLRTDERVDSNTLERIRNIPDCYYVKSLELARQFHILQEEDVDGRPYERPSNPNFGSGPCAKRPGYDLSKLPTNLLGRSHRSAPAKERINKSMRDAKKILGIPDDYQIGIIAGSNTGAIEMAMWSLLNKEREVDVIFMEQFGNDWYKDTMKELKVKVNKIEAPFGELPDLYSANTQKNDVIFTWNGTTSGVKIPNGEWISDDREGLTFCDATSAAFAMDLPWKKLDVTTFSWQKVLGGEAAHGVIVASPRAMERFRESKDTRPWPMPKIFRFTEGIFKGEVINTPSLLCIEDFIDSLSWAESIGGLETLKKISNKNLQILEDFVQSNKWISFLAEDKSFRSNTSICLKLNLNKDQTKMFLKYLENEQVAFDINSYKSAPMGIRIWGGATVKNTDTEILTKWLTWAYDQVIINAK